MKEPTTQYQKSLAERDSQVSGDYLKNFGFTLDKETPLLDTYRNGRVTVSIGLYGELSVVEWHWCNNTPERVFTTINPALTTNDFHHILKLLNIQL